MGSSVVLIPCSLSQKEISEQFKTPYFVEAIKACDVFFVENLRSARRFISACKTGLVIQDLKFEVLDKKTSTRGVELLFEKYENAHVGVLSESGCPGVADPGSVAVDFAHRKGWNVKPLVGPSSILLGLMGSGFNGQRFCFQGYIPIDSKERKSKLVSMENESRQKNQTQIFIETPFRNEAMIKDVLKALHPNTQLCIGKNLTDSSETIVTKSIGEWRKEEINLHKVPCIFLIYSGKA